HIVLTDGDAPHFRFEQPLLAQLVDRRKRAAGQLGQRQRRDRPRGCSEQRQHRGLLDWQLKLRNLGRDVRRHAKKRLVARAGPAARARAFPARPCFASSPAPNSRTARAAAAQTPPWPPDAPRPHPSPTARARRRTDSAGVWACSLLPRDAVLVELLLERGPVQA